VEGTTIGYRPLGDRVVVRLEKVDEMYKGRLYLPQSVVHKNQQLCKVGTVVAIGPGMLCADGTRYPMADVALGDRVLLMREGGIDITVGEEKFLSIRDDLIIAVLDDETKAA